MAEIKLLALDLDGTLLNGEKQISPRTRAALDRVRQQGVLVVPVTGRPSQGIPQAVLDLPGLRYAVSSNGATIRDLATGQVLLEKLLPAATCLEVLDRCAQVPMLREVFRAGVGYLSQGDYETLRARYAGTSMLQYHLDTRQVLPGTVAEFLQADPRPVEELFFLTGSPQEKAALRDLLTGIQGIGFADPFPNDLEVIAGDIDKGEALRFLLRHLGLEASQVLAMGDGGERLAPPPGRRHWRGHGQRHRGGEGRGGLRHHLLRRGRGGGGPGEVRAVTEPCPILGGRELSSCGAARGGLSSAFVLRGGGGCAPAGWGPSGCTYPTGGRGSYGASGRSAPGAPPTPAGEPDFL